MDKYCSIISHWGYIAVFLGTLIEGEVTMVVSGFLASQNLLDIRSVLAVGALGGFLGDQLFFLAGKLSNKAKFLKKLERNVRYRKARRIVRKYGAYIILFSRYLVGMRMALSFALGVMKVPFKEFSLLNFLSALVWAPTVGFLGYLLGSLAMKLLGDFKRYEAYLIVAACLVAVAAYLFKKAISRVEERKLS